MSRLAIVLAFLLGMVAIAPAQTRPEQNVLSREEAQKLDESRRLITKIEGEQEAQSDSFSGLLELRDQLDPVRDALRGIVKELQQKLTAAQAQLSELGPAPAANAAPEPADQASVRKTKQTLVSQIETHLRGARALLVQADQLWDELTDARRDLFNSRIFEHQDSFLYPSFWGRVVNEGWPNFLFRLNRKVGEIKESIDEKEGWSILAGLALLMGVMLVALVWFHVRLARQRRHLVPENAESLGKGAIVLHAAFILAMHVVPFFALAGIIWLSVTRFDIAPEEVDNFLIGFGGAIVVYGLGIGAARAVFSPANARFRIIRADDRMAARIVHVLNAMLAVYLIGLVVMGLAQMLSAHLTITVAATGLFAAAVVGVGGLLLLRPSSDTDADHERGLVQAPLHLLRPIFWLVALAIAAALSLGFISFAGFIIGRALATAIILCLAVLIYVAVETVFHDAMAPGKAVNLRIARTIGVKTGTVDLAGTIIAGAMRLTTVILTVLVLFSPWGVEFGNINPFEDVFFGVKFGDLRSWIGAAGIAVILFTVGLVGTRLFVAWLDSQLLPRTALNTGVRHSISTIAGYVGFVLALTIALSLAGVQLQNIALVASALSVGIGFGLQQVVQNFVAGLIVLAERPIRVGDTIVVKGEEGKVTRINVRATELQLGENSTVIVPNADIVSSIVKNRSLTDPTHRATLKLSVAHGTDLKALFELMIDEAIQHPHVVKHSRPTAYVQALGETGVDVDLNVIVDSVGKISAVRSDLYLALLERFREKGIRLGGAGAALPPPANAG